LKGKKGKVALPRDIRDIIKKTPVFKLLKRNKKNFI
jgi:hypothetical protein